MKNHNAASNSGKSRYWFERHARSVIFMIVSLALVGGYLAFTVPVAVFPATNFPRILIAVDNGVMPIDQMMVTITRPLEEAVNSVPGLQNVRSITSRGSAEIDLFFDWNVDMFQTLQYVNAALSRVQSELPASAKIEAHRLTFASFPIIGYSFTAENIDQTKLWEMVTYEIKPRLNRLDGVSTVLIQGGQEPEFHIVPDPAKLLVAGVTVPDILESVRRTNLIDSPGLLEENHQLVLGLINGQVRTPEQIADVVIKSTQTGIPVHIGDVATVRPAVKPVYTVVTASGKPSLLINVNRQPDSNTVQVANEVHAEIDRKQPAGEPPASETGIEHDEDINRLLAAEDASTSGFFLKVVNFHEKWLRRALQHPRKLALMSVALIALSYGCYHLLGSDLLPEMDEGGFVLDYIMPAGSSLAETNRVITHVEKMLRETPEVESTSRRTGMQLGLAAVTEANTGDLTVKLKDSRSRGIDEVIEEVRTKIKAEEPALDVEFIQVLQDMIGDLTSAPEPVQIKLFAQDPNLLADWAPKVADSISKIKGIVDVLNGIDNTISGPAVTFQVNPGIAARTGFTPEEVAVDAAAIVEGEPSQSPIVSNDRAYTLRVRFPARSRASIDAMRNTLLTSSTGRTATLGALADVISIPGQTEIRRENLQRQVAVTARLEGTDLGTAMSGVQKEIAKLRLPAAIRVEYGGTYKEQQKSFRDLVFVLVLAIVLVFCVLLFEFGTFAAPLAILVSALLSTSGVFIALLITRTTFNISSFMGMIMVIGIVAKNGILLLDADQKFRDLGFSPEEAILQASRRRLRPIVMTALATLAGMLPLSFALGAGSQMLQPLAIAVIGGVVISMVLSLIITPAVHFFVGRDASSRAAEPKPVAA